MSLSDSLGWPGILGISFLGIAVPVLSVVSVLLLLSVLLFMLEVVPASVLKSNAAVVVLSSFSKDPVVGSGSESATILL